MLVELLYFKTDGKFYADTMYKTEKKTLPEIWEEVQEMADEGRLPDLVEEADEFIVSVTVPYGGAEYNCPKLIMRRG